MRFEIASSERMIPGARILAGRVICLSQEAGEMIDDDITPASETQPGRRATNCNKLLGAVDDSQGTAPLLFLIFYSFLPILTDDDNNNDGETYPTTIAVEPAVAVVCTLRGEGLSFGEARLCPGSSELSLII